MDPQFIQHYLQMIDAMNTLLGYNGQTTLKSSLNLSGNTITGVGSPVSASDAVTLAHANTNYSAAALRPQLEANGASPLQSVRRMNDAGQREQNSSWLNSLLSTAPSANNIQVLFQNATPSAGYTTITLPASQFIYSDGSVSHLNAFSHVATNPGTFSIAASPTGAVSTGTTATITTTSASGVTVGDYVTIAGVTDTDFNGTWQVATTPLTTVFTFATTIAAASSGGGTVTTASVFYFYTVFGNPMPQYLGVPFTSDTPFKRLPASNDQRQLIAVATINSSGGVSAQSAGGATPNSTLNAGSFF